MRHAALLLLGHGSTLNADSSTPTYQHAEELRRGGEFAEVQVGFWKEEPNFRQALRQTALDRVYVVPHFISSGYFTEQVIPRELGLNGPITRLAGQEIYYCQAVGLSPAMTSVLLQRAREVVAATGEVCDPARTCLFICGHGTSLNDNSTKIIHDQAEIIRSRGLYGDCQGVLMEQKPFVKDWRTLTALPNVIVVPFFISDGLHSFEDIPVLLGLTHNIREQGFTNPHRENERRLWYANAIGTDPGMADVILEAVAQFEAEHLPPSSAAPNAPVNFIREDLSKWAAQLTASPGKMGQVQLRRLEMGKIELRHTGDSGKDQAQLRPLNSLAELRELILLGPANEFRPLRAAPTLRPGWVMALDNVEALGLALDYLYPAAVANWSLENRNNLQAIPWSETAERQTGRFRVVRDLSEEAVCELTREVCDRGCLKRRLWSPAAQSVEVKSAEIPLLCPEACNFLVSKAREKIKGPGEE